VTLRVVFTRSLLISHPVILLQRYVHSGQVVIARVRDPYQTIIGLLG